jgi:hypothetical protein
MTKSKYLGLIGQTVGDLTILGFIRKGLKKYIYLKAQCKCGSVIYVSPTSLNKSKYKTCASCYRSFKIAAGRVRETRTYRSWQMMKSRVLGQGRKDWWDRGITAKKEWMESYQCFLSDMGEVPDGFTIERIDNDKGYYPENCKWASYKEQNNNKRNNRRFEINGLSYTLSEIAEQFNVDYKSLYYFALKKQMSIQDAISQVKLNNKTFKGTNNRND